MCIWIRSIHFSQHTNRAGTLSVASVVELTQDKHKQNIASSLGGPESAETLVIIVARGI